MSDLSKTTKDLHFENQVWERELDHWKDELRSLQDQLKVITEGWSSDVEKDELDKFERLFKSHTQDVQGLIIKIEEHEDQLADKGIIHYTSVSELGSVAHQNIRSRMSELRKEHIVLKKDYHDFLKDTY